MAFTIANWGCQQPSLNAGQETIVPYGGSSTVENTCNVFTYSSPNDAVATIVAANYFLSMWPDLSVNDIIWGNGTDASFAVQVTAVSSTSVTVASMGLTTSIGTANIVDDAVTYAKLQDSVADNTLLGNPGGGAGAEFVEVTLGNDLSFSAGALQIAPTVLNYATVAITAAEFNGMYAAPKLLIAAPGANKLIVLERAVLAMTFVAAAYANGGVVAFQWDSTVHGAGQHASNTEAAADFFAAASSAFMFVGNSGNASTVDGGLVPFAANVNKGLYLSNLTGAFDTGDGTWVAHIWYKIIPTV